MASLSNPFPCHVRHSVNIHQRHNAFSPLNCTRATIPVFREFTPETVSPLLPDLPRLCRYGFQINPSLSRYVLDTAGHAMDADRSVTQLRALPRHRPYPVSERRYHDRKEPLRVPAPVSDSLASLLSRSRAYRLLARQTNESTARYASCSDYVPRKSASWAIQKRYNVHRGVAITPRQRIHVAGYPVCPLYDFAFI